MENAWVRVFEALGECYQDGRVSLELCDQLSRTLREACDETVRRHLVETTALRAEIQVLMADLTLAEEALDAYAGQSLAGYKALRAGWLEQHHAQCPWDKADPSRTRSVCGCPEGWPRRKE